MSAAAATPATQPARSTPSPPAVPTQLVPLGSRPASVEQPSTDTPARLRRLRLVVVASGVALAILGTTAMVLLTLTLRQAANEVEQLVRVQTIETDLLVADANATNTFLVGGLESPQRRAAYDAALAEVADLVAQSARAQPADAAALSALNADVLTYSGLVEAARANNRQGLPVGAQYLKQASNGLRSDALPLADALVEANSRRALDALTTGWGWAVPLLALGAGTAFVVVQIKVARQFRRRVNAGLLTGSLVLVGLALTSTVALATTAASVGVASSDFGDTRLFGDARLQANLAKSDESLTLIARGSGTAYENAWGVASSSVEDHLMIVRDGDVLLQQWRSYTTIHQQIRGLDDGGRWDEAVALATGSGEETSNAAFAAFDKTVAGAVAGTGRITVTSLRSHQTGLVVGCVLTLLAGLGAAFAGSRGIAARLREYR